ncbi:MAG: DUF192 domain-containing protein [bacterium]|nr:DUF192 domain-containing protein [bacterium]
MKEAHWRVLGIIGILLFIFAAFQGQKKEIQIGETTLKVEVADTNKERSQGLSGRDLIAENEGMLFVFKEPRVYGFWMKDMNFAIDIVWIDSKKKVVGVERNIAPKTFPEVFYPAEPIQYVLEVNAGFAERNDIQPRDIVTGL